MTYLRLMGRCLSGSERDSGSFFHAVPEDGLGRALCGAKPGRRSAGWSARVGTEATCPACLRKLAVIARAVETIRERNPGLLDGEITDSTVHTLISGLRHDVDTLAARVYRLEGK